MAADPLATPLLTNLAVIVVAAAAAAMLARRVRQPTVVGFLAAGILLGPLLGLVGLDPFLEVLGEFGVALLLFLVGLQLSLRELRAIGSVSVIAGLAQLAGSAAGGYLIALALGYPAGVAFFLAFALAFSSTVVVVKILMDLGDLGKTYGRLAVGIFLVQDLVIILPLALIPVLGGAQGIAGGGWPGVAAAAARSVASTLLLVAAALAAGRWALPPVFRWASPRPGLVLLLGLAWLFAAVAATQVVGVSLEVGAFAAGMSLAGIPYSRELKRRVEPILHLFIALFFVGLGLGFSLERSGELAPAVLALSAFVVVVNAVVLTLTLGWLGYPRETSFRTGITVGQVSEFSFILAAMALTEGLIEESVRDLVVLVGMLTMAVSAVLIWWSGPLYERVARFPLIRSLPAGERGLEGPPERHEDHVLVLGWDELGPALVRGLRARHAEADVVVIAVHADLPHGLPQGVRGVYADPWDLEAVDAAGFDRARVVVANLPEPDVVRVLLERTRARPPIIARAETAAAAWRLREAGAAAVISVPDLVAEAALRRVVEGGGAPG